MDYLIKCKKCGTDNVITRSNCKNCGAILEKKNINLMYEEWKYYK